MKLGNYVAIELASEHRAAMAAFFDQLGFVTLDEATFTDGCVNVHLVSGAAGWPVLHYQGSDVTSIKGLFKRKSPKAQDEPTAKGGQFRDPNGLQVRIHADASPHPMPEGTPTQRQARSLCGTLGEFTVPTKDLAASMMFWTKLGFEALHMAQIPYHYAIISDGHLVLGLHQNDQPQPALTYFEPDMPERIAKIAALNITVHDLTPQEGQATQNAMIVAPNGQPIFLFTGAVFK